MNNLKDVLKESKYEEFEKYYKVDLKGSFLDSYVVVYKESQSNKYLMVAESGKKTYASLPTLAYIIDNYGMKG